MSREEDKIDNAMAIMLCILIGIFIVVIIIAVIDEIAKNKRIEQDYSKCVTLEYVCDECFGTIKLEEKK